MTLQDSDIYTAEIENWDGTAVQTIRAADGGGAGFTTLSTDTPPSVFYPSYIKAFAMQSRSAFGDRQTKGAAEVSDGDLVCFNLNGNGAPFDQYRSRAFDARFVTVRRGQRSGAYPSSWRTLLRSPMHAPVWNHDDVMFRVRDARKLTSVPLQPTLYAGTNVAGVGLEGTPDDLKGKPKPVAFGRSFNVSPPCVNAQQGSYQFADNSATVSDVRDGGRSLGLSFPLTSRTVPFGHTSDGIRDVTSGGGVYIAVGQDASGYGSFRSTDGGTTWAAVNINAFGGVVANRVAYSDSLGLFVAVGSRAAANQNIYKSSDGGVSWSIAGTIPAPINNATIAAVAWSPVLGLFVAGGSASEFATSPDGNVWTNRVITANSWQIRRAVWGKDRFVISGWDTTNSVGLIAWSTDGINWTQATSPILGAIGVASLPSLTYDSIVNRYVVASDGTTNFATSEDAKTWTLRTSDGSTGWQGLASNDGLFVAVNGNNLLASSYDGIAWTLQTTGISSATLRGITIVGSKVVIVGTNAIWTTADVLTYATLADFQSNDASLVPAKGTYKTFQSSTFSGFRLGSPAIGTITCDVVQGTTAADRTGAQIMVQAFKRAGLGTANTALWSEDFSNAAYTKTALTVGANATTAPDGFATADKLQETNATSSHFAYQAVVCASAQYTYSVYVKAAERTKCVVDLWDGVTGEASIGIDLSNGSTFATGIAVGSWTGISWYVEDARNGWYRVSLTATRGAGTECRLVIYTWTTAISYTGTTGSGVYAWGEQLNAGAIAKAYTPTTTVAVIGGDWRAVQIVALDAANSAEMGCWYGPDDTEAKCADPIDLAAQSLGAWWAGDANGVICTKRLIDPNQNLVTSPDTITAGAGWTYTGTLAGAAAFSTLVLGRDSIPLTRLTNASGGSAYRAITLTGNGVKRYAVVLQWDGVAGTTIHGLFDVTAGVFIALATVTWSAAGVATSPATPTNGTLIRLAALGGNAYRLVLESTTATATNTHRAYAHSTGTATSIRVGRVDVQDSVPVAVFGESDLQNTLIPLESGDENEGISPYQIRIQYARNYTVQTDGLDGAVSGAERAQFGLEWREAKATNAAVLTAHPLSQPQIIQTAYAFEADAQTEATRLLALKGTDREWYSVPSKLTDASLNVEMGDVAEVVNGRFGLAGGALVSALGIAPVLVMGGSSNTLTTWR